MSDHASVKPFGHYMILAMNAIDEAYKHGYLLYGEDFENKHQNLSDSQRYHLIFGATTHIDLFEQTRHPNGKRFILEFRLRPGVSASKALTAILSSGESIIDCGTAIGLAQYYAILLSFWDIYNSDAEQRFDNLFGSSVHDLPMIQRMLIAGNPLNGTVRGQNQLYFDATNERFYPLNPISFLFEVSPLAFKYHAANGAHSSIARLRENLLSQLEIGSFITFQGSEAYLCKHPSGAYGNFNCIVAGHHGKEVELHTFGIDLTTESKLKEIHVQAHSKPRTKTDTMIGEKHGYVYIPQLHERICDIPGLNLLTHVTLNQNNYLCLLRASNYLEKFTEYLHEQAAARGSILSLNESQLSSTLVSAARYDNLTTLITTCCRNEKIQINCPQAFIHKMLEEQCTPDPSCTKGGILQRRQVSFTPSTTSPLADRVAIMPLSSQHLFLNLYGHWCREQQQQGMLPRVIAVTQPVHIESSRRVCCL